MKMARMCEIFVTTIVAGWLYSGCLAQAQNPQCPTRPYGDSTNACASTAFVQNALAGAVLSVSNVDGTLTISPTTGNVVASLNLSHANTWLALQTFSAGVNANWVTINGGGTNDPGWTLGVNPKANSLNYGILATQSLSGSAVITTNANLWSIASDNAAITGSSNFLNHFLFQASVGGSAMRGGRNLLEVALNFTAASNAANANRNYSAFTPIVQVSSSDGGTPGAGQGAFFGINPNVATVSGATGLYHVTAAEFDINTQSGSSVDHRHGIAIVDIAVGGINGGLEDVAEIFYGGIGATNFNVGIQFGSIIAGGLATYPVKTAGTLVKALAGTVAHGIDFSAATFSSDFLKGPGSYSVDGSGNTLGGTYNKVTITAPASAATFTLANNSSLITSGAFSATFTFTNTTTVTFPTSGTLATTGGANIPTVATGDLLYGSAANVLSALADVATGNALISGGVSTAPSWGKITSAHLNITTTSCTNQFVTAISASGVGTCTTATLASAQFANQGTATTVLHGNAAGNPSFAAVSLTADVTGTLPAGSGGTGITSLGTGIATFLGTPSSANLAAAVTDETGSGALVFAATPTLTGTTTFNTPPSGGLVFNATSTDTGQTYFQLGNTSTNSDTWQFAIAGSSQPQVGAFYFYDTSSGRYVALYSPDGGLALCNSGATIPPVDGLRLCGTTASTSKTTGTLINSGGFGNAGAIYTDTLNIITVANTSTTRALCWDNTTGLVSENGTVGTCTVSALFYKERIKSISGREAIEALLVLRTEVFQYKNEYHTKFDAFQHVGLYADDVEKMDKRCAAYTVSGRLDNYEERCVLAYSVAAINELKADNDNLRAELARVANGR